MADNVTELSTTASSNSAYSGISILGTAPVSNFDDALRALGAMIRSGMDTGNIMGSAYLTKSGSYTLLTTDRGKTVNCTAALTLAAEAAATLGSGWICFVKANGGDVTIDPDGTETIDGSTTYIVYDGQTVMVLCDGTGFQVLALKPAPATAADQETGTSALKMVTPSQQHRHPSAAKAWARVTESAGSYTLAAGYNIDSVTKNATGNITVNFATDFSSANYACVVSAEDSGAMASVSSPVAGSVAVRIFDTTPSAYDDGFYLVAFGDQ